MRNDDYLKTFNIKPVIETQWSMPPTANKMLARLMDDRHQGFVPNHELSGQREIFQRLEWAGAIHTTTIYPDGRHYRVMAASVVWKRPQFYPFASGYLNWRRAIKAHFDKHPNGTVTFDRMHQRTYAEWCANARVALDRRINLKAGLDAPRGRRDTEHYQTELRRDADDLNRILTQRIRIYQFRTPEMRKRFGHLLARRDD